MIVFRILISVLALVAFVFLAIWGDLFRAWKLQLAGHRIIEAQSSILGSFANREFFFSAQASDDQNGLLVISKITRGNKYQDGMFKVSYFDLNSGIRKWETNLEQSKKKVMDWSPYILVWRLKEHKVLISCDLKTYLVDTKSGMIKESYPLSLFDRIYLQISSKELKNLSSGLGNEPNIALIENKELKLVWKKDFSKKIEQSIKKYEIQSLERINYSPNLEFYWLRKYQSLEIYKSTTKKLKYPEFSTLWDTYQVIWSPDSSMIAISGDNYGFTGVDGEIIFPQKNVLLANLGDNSVKKRRLLTYGEYPRSIGFLEDGKKLFGVTDSTIIIWNLTKR